MRDLIRQVVSSYQGLKLEGQGQGYVQFSAQEPDSKQPVVIKILPRVLGKDPKIAARFRALSQTIRQLNHPNITTVREVGEKAGLPYLVVRAVERAQPLADRLNQPWAIDSAADVVMQAGQALEHAYNKGLVHGSLSPNEIVMQPDGRVQVTDFGLAQLLDLAGIKLQQTESPYAAPERLAGKPPDPRSDVYSLGAILYSMLARRAPMIVQGQVLAPSRFNPDVPAALDAVVTKALAPSPAERYADVKSFLAALGAVALIPAAAKVAARVQGGAAKAAPGQSVRCPRCGAENQKGRFCRRCGAPLDAKAGAKSAAAPPKPPTGQAPAQIQVTTIEVGKIEVGKGIETRETTIARPLAVTSGEAAAMFPEPLQMPVVDARSLNMGLGDQNMPAMPEPPPIPAINWTEMVPPLPKVPSIDDIQATQEGG